MPAFPVLIPSTRSYTPGNHPSSQFSALSGRQTRVMHSNTALDCTLRLSFLKLTETGMFSIFAHYHGQQGTFIPFDLPPEIFSGMAGSTFVQAGHLWRYANVPQATETPSDLGFVLYDVQVELESVPPVGSFIAGMNRRLGLQLSTGAVSAGASVSGADLVLTLSLETGAVST